MSSLTAPEPLCLRLNRARILLRHWQGREVVEGYVREFSPDASHCRVTSTPREREKGTWLRCADYRCVEVLEANFDFKTWNVNEKERRARDRAEDGEDWKFPREDGGDE